MAGPSDLTRIADEAVREITAAADETALESARVKYLSRRDGVLTGATKAIATLPNAEKPAYGQAVNEAKRRIEAALETRGTELRGGAISKSLSESADLTLPPRRVRLGRLHPISQTIREITRVLATMGFEAVEGPEVEFDYYNFEALNIPRDHPARDKFNTLWIGNPLGDDAQRPVLLRTHTSPMQIRVMEQRKPPVRVVVPGRCHDGRSQRRPVLVRAPALRRRAQSEVPPRLLSVHGAVSGDRVRLLRLRRHGHDQYGSLRDLRRRGLDRGGRLRHGPSGGAAARWL